MSMTPNRDRRQRLIAKLTFHHSGVFPSMTAAIRTEIQAMLRWLATSGMRSSSTGGACNLRSVTGAAITGLHSSLPRELDLAQTRRQAPLLCEPFLESAL